MEEGKPKQKPVTVDSMLDLTQLVEKMHIGETRAVVVADESDVPKDHGMIGFALCRPGEYNTGIYCPDYKNPAHIEISKTPSSRQA